MHARICIYFLAQITHFKVQEVTFMECYKSIHWCTKGAKGQRAHNKQAAVHASVNEWRWVHILFLCWHPSPSFLPGFVVSTQCSFYQEPMHQNTLLQVKMSEGRRGYEAAENWHWRTEANKPLQLVTLHMLSVYTICMCTSLWHVCMQVFIGITV